MEALDPLKMKPAASSTTSTSTVDNPVSSVGKDALQKPSSSTTTLSSHKAEKLDSSQTVNIAGFPVAITTLEDLAIRQGYGYKAANLIMTQEEVKHIKLNGASVKVPPFIPLKDSEMQEYLNQAIPELPQLWEDFLNSFDPQEKEKFLSDSNRANLTISPKGMEIIAKIQEKITTHFQNNDFQNDKLKEWTAQNSSALLMVRSSGKEDTDESSNAGGNESVDSVKNDPRTISESLGRVVSSYFSQKSITQRLVCRDKTLFTEPKPFVPVIIQVMIKEEPNNIPRSGVMFTSQHGRSSQITMIQTGYGHNEGIVANKVGVDTYFVDREQHVHSVVRKKETRVKESALVQNETKMQTAPALSQAMVGNMKIIADHMEGIYKKPLDMEYTIRKENGEDVVYLLQRRPLKKPQVETAPSYVDFDKSRVKPYSGAVIASEGAQVIHAKEKNNILFAHDITQALEKYNAPNTDRDKIKAIIISRPAAATSHQAVFLQAQGLAILTIEGADFVTLEKEKEWTIDVQQGLVIGGSLSPELIHSGYISYPIPRELTVEVPSIAKAQMIAAKETDPVKKERLERFVKRELTKMNKEVPALIKMLSGGETLPPIENIRALLRQIALQDKDQAKKALAALLEYFSKNMAGSVKMAKGTEETQLAKWMAYETLVNIIKNELIPAIDKYPPQSLERLYPLKFVEALILQRASKDTVGGFSFGLVAQTDKKEKAVLSEAKTIAPDAKLSTKAFIALNFKTEIYRKETQAKWIEYVSTLSEKELDQLISHLAELQKFGIAGEWLNIRFPASANPLKEIERELSNNRQLFTELEKSVALANKYEASVHEWGNPAYAEKNRREFTETMVRTAALLEETYAKADWMGKMAIVGVSSQVIDVYDKTIKAVTGSTQFSSKDQKLEVFRELLKGYRQLVELTIGDSQVRVGEFPSMKEFLAFIDNSVEGERELSSTADPFIARKVFKLDPLLIGYKGQLQNSMRMPFTGEEFFSVYHQNLIIFNNIRKNELGLSTDLLPTEIKNVLSTFPGGLPNPNFIQKNNDKLHIQYNIPLAMHSGTYNFIIDLKNPETFQVEMNVFGISAFSRFERIGSIAALLAHTGTLQYGDLPLSADGKSVLFSLKIAKGQDIEQIFTNLEYMMHTMPLKQYSFKELQKTFAIDLSKVREKAFSDTLFFNAEIMKMAAEEGNWELVANVAKQTFLGVGSNPIKGRTLDSVIFATESYSEHYTPALKDLIGKFNGIPGNNNGNTKLNSLRVGTALYLVRCLQEGGKAAEAARRAITEISSNSSVAANRQINEIVQALKKVSETL